MPDKTTRYNFEANTAGFLAGLKAASKGLDQLAAKVTTVMQRMNTAAVGTSPAFTAIKNSALALTNQFTVMGNTMDSVMNQMTINTRILNTSVDSMASSIVNATMAINQAAAQAVEKIQTAVPVLQEVGAAGVEAGKEVSEGAEESITPTEETTTATKGWGSALSKVIDSASNLKKVFSGALTILKDVTNQALQLFGIALGGDFLGESTSLAKDYIETLNLFNVAMGRATVQATAFMNKLSGTLGLDPSSLMNIQGRFKLLASSMGNTTNKAYIMSEGLTQLSIDIASLWNKDVEDVQAKLASGFVGYSRAVRDLGIDISLIAIQEEARLEGLKVNVRTLSQASKMQLRYNAMLRQSAAAQGDFARTAEQPANQMRILSEQFAITSRYIGAIFLPAIARVIPYIIAFIQVIGVAAEAVASLFGWGDLVQQAKDNAAKAGDSINLYGDDIENLGNEADTTGQKIKDMTVQGFDEMNKLDKVTNSASSGLAGGGGINIDIPILSYDMGLSTVMLKATEIFNTIKDLWNEFTATPEFAALIRTLGTAWDIVTTAAKGAWDIITGFFTFLSGHTDWALPVAAGVTVFLASIALIGGPVGLILGIIGGFVTAISLIPTEVDKLDSSLAKSVQSITPMIDDFNSAVANITDVSKIVDSNGNTLADVDKDITTVEGKITEALKKARLDQGTERAQDLLDIKKYIEDLKQLNLEKLGIYILNSKATYEQIKYEISNNAGLTQKDIAQKMTTLNAAFEEENKQRELAKQTELQYIYQRHEAAGTLNSQLYKVEYKDAVERWDTQAKLSQTRYSDEIKIILDYFKDHNRISTSNYQKITNAKEQYNADVAAIDAQYAKEMADNTGSWVDVYEAQQLLTQTHNEDLIKLQKDYNTTTKGLYDTLGADQDNAFLTMVANAKSGGFDLNDQMKNDVVDLLTVWSPLADEMNGVGKDSLLKLISGLEVYIPELKNSANMTTTEILDTLAKGLGIDTSTGMYDVGWKATNDFSKGIGSGSSAVITKIRGLADLTTAQLTSMFGTSAFDTGKNLMQGMADGITANTSKVYDTLKVLAKQAISTVNHIFEIKSPSKVMFETGKYITEGLALGIEKNSRDILSPLNYNTSLVSSSYASLPRSSSVNTTSASSGINEDALYRAVSRAIQEMPTPVLNLEGERIAIAVNSANNLIDRRYGK